MDCNGNNSMCSTPREGKRKALGILGGRAYCIRWHSVLHNGGYEHSK